MRPKEEAEDPALPADIPRSPPLREKSLREREQAELVPELPVSMPEQESRITEVREKGEDQSFLFENGKR